MPTLDLGEAAVLVDGDEPDVHELAERLVDFVHLALTVQEHSGQSGNNNRKVTQHLTIIANSNFSDYFPYGPHTLAFLCPD